MKKNLLLLLVLFTAFGKTSFSQCASNATSTADEDILNVTFGTLNNSSTCATTGGAGSILNEYSNYTGISAPNVAMCSTIPFSIQIGTCGGNYSNAVAIYIDWNNDADFVDAGENVYLSAASTSGPHTETGNITIPSTTFVGTKRMRVVNVETTPSSITPCGTYSWGETEDYMINVTAAAAMAFVSSNSFGVANASVTKCDVNQQMVRIEVVVSGCGAPLLSLSSLTMTTAGSTAILSDVSKIHIYYTGNSSVFSSSNEFVAGGTAPLAGAMTINGSQTLSSGTNYFWIAYDILTSSGTGNSVRASCSQINVGGLRIPTSTPTGISTIAVCPSYPSTKALGLQHWVKSDVGVTGSPVSAWGDQSSGTSITGNLVQATGANQPSLVNNGVNFQPYIRFDGSNDILVSANTFSGNAMFNTTNNTVLMVKNIKSGLVDYKWETDPTNATRMGFELNGTTQRLDFVDDLTGKNAISTTNITNIDVIVGGITDATTNTLKLNGVVDAVNNHGGITFSPSAATLKPLNIGANDLGNPLYCNVDIAEVMTFNVKLGSSELKRVESYLALKYGITLGNNQGASSSVSYMSSDGTQIWNNQTGYHNNVIGIGRDNTAGNSGLNKLRSKSVLSLNSAVDVLTIANGANMGGSAFGSDKSFFITGHNAQSLPSSIASLSDLPAGIVTRLSRVWKGQETGTVGTISLKFDLSSVIGVGGVNGANNLADIRLLVDQDGVFASGATQVAPSGFSNTVDTVVFQFDFTAGTGFYYTIGSVNYATAPLPITLTYFTSKCYSDGIIINWGTASELNNNYFELERSTDGANFTLIGTIPGHGTTEQQNTYSFLDMVSDNVIYYYRLKQVDFSNKSTYYNITTTTDLSCQTKDTEVIVYPNPANSNLNIKITNSNDFTIEIFNDCGQIVYNSSKKTSGETNFNIQTAEFASGIYAVRVIDNYKTIVKKVTITH